MIHVRPLAELNAHDLRRLMTGYTAEATYQVSKMEADNQIAFTLELVPLAQVQRKQYDAPDEAMLAYYRQVVALGFSFGAYDGEECVGILLAEPQSWHQSLWVRELHVADDRRGGGIGRRLIDAAADKGRAAGLRTLVCETQNSNVPAIRFYQRLGFQFEGIDLSYYTNSDFPDGEIAVFMKKKLLL